MLAGVHGLLLHPVMPGAKRSEKGFARRQMLLETVLGSILMEWRRKLSRVLWQIALVGHLIKIKRAKFRVKGKVF